MSFDDPNTIEQLQQQIAALKLLIASKDSLIGTLQTLCNVMIDLLQRHGPPK